MMICTEAARRKCPLSFMCEEKAEVADDSECADLIVRSEVTKWMSEYTGGPLDALAKLFLEALRTDDPNEQNRLIDEWNKEIKRLNAILKVR